MASPSLSLATRGSGPMGMRKYVPPRGPRDRSREAPPSLRRNLLLRFGVSPRREPRLRVDDQERHPRAPHARGRRDRLRPERRLRGHVLVRGNAAARVLERALEPDVGAAVGEAYHPRRPPSAAAAPPPDTPPDGLARDFFAALTHTRAATTRPCASGVGPPHGSSARRFLARSRDRDGGNSTSASSPRALTSATPSRRTRDASTSANAAAFAAAMRFRAAIDPLASIRKIVRVPARRDIFLFRRSSFEMNTRRVVGGDSDSDSDEIEGGGGGNGRPRRSRLAFCLGAAARRVPSTAILRTTPPAGKTALTYRPRSSENVARRFARPARGAVRVARRNAASSARAKNAS